MQPLRPAARDSASANRDATAFDAPRPRHMNCSPLSRLRFFLPERLDMPNPRRSGKARRGLMILATWRARRANRILIEQLHGDIVAAARRPALFLDFDAPDTLEGRFEMIALHAGLAIRRLSAIPGVGLEIAQELADSVFRHF